LEGGFFDSHCMYDYSQMCNFGPCNRCRHTAMQSAAGQQDFVSLHPTIAPHPTIQSAYYSLLQWNNRQRRTFVIAPLSRHCHHRGTQVLCVHPAASNIPALDLLSHSRYSFIDPKRMEGWVSWGPECKEQLAHGCYATACSQCWTRTHDLVVAGRAHKPLPLLISSYYTTTYS